MLICTARVEVGLSPGEFYSLTPRTFSALLKATRAKADRNREHFEFMFAQNTLWVMYGGMHPPSDPVELKDLMPSQRRRKPLTDAEKSTALTEKLRKFNTQVEKARNGR